MPDAGYRTASFEGGEFSSYVGGGSGIVLVMVVVGGEKVVLRKKKESGRCNYLGTLILYSPYLPRYLLTSTYLGR